MDDLAHMAQLGVQLGAAQHLAVHAAQAHAAAAQLGDQIFVHLTGQHLLHDLHGGVVGHPQTVGEMALHAHLLEHLVDGRAAAVHQHDAHAQQREGDQIVHDGIFQFFVDHGVATVFHDHGLSVILLDVGCRLREQARHFFVFHIRPSCHTKMMFDASRQMMRFAMMFRLRRNDARCGAYGVSPSAFHHLCAKRTSSCSATAECIMPAGHIMFYNRR